MALRGRRWHEVEEVEMEDGAGGWRECVESKPAVDATKVEWWRMQVVVSAESREALIQMEEERSCKEET